VRPHQALAGELVQVLRQPLAEAPAVGEDDRRAVRAHELEEPRRRAGALLDRRELDRELARGQRWAGFLDDLCTLTPPRLCLPGLRRRRHRDADAGEEAMPI